MTKEFARCKIEIVNQIRNWLIHRKQDSLGSVGDSYDNAMAESVIGLYKTEVINKNRPWKRRQAVEFATLAWVDWFNNRRLLEPIGNIPPAELEQMYYQDKQGQAMVA